MTDDALRLSPADAKARLDSRQAIMLDVVAPSAWDQIDAAIPGALRIPPDELESHLQELPKHRELIAYCT